MKVLNSSWISSFGGLNFVLEELCNLHIDLLINRSLPELPAQSQFSWKDILYSYWSILFCGGDCAEDISVNLGASLAKNPFVKGPSPDRFLARLKELSDPVQHFNERKGKVENDFSMNDCLNILNVKLLKRMSLLKGSEKVLDYDNMFVFTDKSDAKYTYYKQKGYCPGVGIIGNNIVYVENRNGNCALHTGLFNKLCQVNMPNPVLILILDPSFSNKLPICGQTIQRIFCCPNFQVVLSIARRNGGPCGNMPNINLAIKSVSSRYSAINRCILLREKLVLALLSKTVANSSKPTVCNLHSALIMKTKNFTRARFQPGSPCNCQCIFIGTSKNLDTDRELNSFA